MAEECMALLSLPHHLGEALEEVVRDAVSPSTLSPYIVLHKEDSVLGTTRFEVYADSVLVCGTGSLVRAILHPPCHVLCI